jgi:hypothetical protein
MTEFWQTALLTPLTTLANSVIAILPNVLAMTIILAIGIFAAWAAGQLTERLLRVLRVDHLCDRIGVSAALLRGGVKADPSHLAGRLSYWLVAAFAVLTGVAALNLPPVNHFIQSVLGYIPHLLTAGLILVAGYLLSNFVFQAVLIAAVNAGLPPARAVAVFSRWGVQLVAVAMALEQLGIAQTIVVVGFGIAFGGVVLASAIAFGLGARDLAKEFLEQRLSSRRQDRSPDDLRHL